MGEEHPETLITLASLGQVRVLQKHYPEAESDLRRALTTYEKARPDTWERYNCESVLGASMAGQTRFAEAEPLLVAGYEEMMQRQATMTAADRANLRDAGERIVQLYQHWGKPEQAAEWRIKLKASQGEAEAKDCGSGLSAGISTTKRLPSGARSKF